MTLSSISAYLDKLLLFWNHFRLGWQMMVAYDCTSDFLDFTSKYERFFVCNLKYFRFLFGALFLLLILPFLIRVVVKVVALVGFLWTGLMKIGRVLGGFLESTRKQPVPKKGEERPVKKEKKRKRGKAIRKKMFSLGGSWRYLREVAFFEARDENLGGPFWSAFFLLSTFITPFLGLFFLVPLQMIFSSLFGFYAIYRVIRYRVLLDPKMSYYWEGKKGPGLYILVAGLILLYGTVLFTAFALMEFIT